MKLFPPCPVCQRFPLCTFQAWSNGTCGSCGAALLRKTLFGLGTLSALFAFIGLVSAVALSIYFLDSWVFVVGAAFVALVCLLIEAMRPSSPDVKDIRTQVAMKRLKIDTRSD